MSQNEVQKLMSTPDSGDQMPVMFVGHGSPMNAIEDNEFTRGWHEAGQKVPKPKAILCISAHWETRGTMVTAVEKPRTIHDFGGFPRALFEVEYPAPGSEWLSRETKATIDATLDLNEKNIVELDHEWGLDHGCWSILKPMFPDADIPVVQLSLDVHKRPQDHYELARELAPLRKKGVLIMGSGNIVHNLRRVVLPTGSISDFNTPFGLDWALEASALIKDLINENHHDELINFRSLGRSVDLAVPTPEHYLPLLYALALKEEDENVSYFNDKALAGSLTMTSLIIDQQTH